MKYNIFKHHTVVIGHAGGDGHPHSVPVINGFDWPDLKGAIGQWMPMIFLFLLKTTNTLKSRGSFNECKSQFLTYLIAVPMEG